MTPSVGVAYCTAAEMLSLHDWEAVAAYCHDSDGPRPQRATLLNPATPAGAILSRALSAASGRIDSAVRCGKRYSPQDLAGLTGTARDYLVKLTADVAYWTVAQRRAPVGSSPDNVPGVKDALEDVQQLAKGERIFGLVEPAEAGLPVAVVPPARRRPAVERAGRLYGTHGQRDT